MLLFPQVIYCSFGYIKEFNAMHLFVAKRQTLPNGIETRSSISQHSSISQADDAFSPYARVNYEKLQKVENPYAQVNSINTNEQDENSSDETVLLR